MKILYTTDRSDYSKLTANYLKALPFRNAFDIKIVSVIPLSTIPPLPGCPPAITALIEDEKKAIQEHLICTESGFKKNASHVASTLRVGSPGHEIVEESAAEASDLIVMGAVGKSAIERILLGSVSDWVATHADCSTLVVRPGKDGAATSPPRRILLAIANTEDDERLIRFMERFHWPDETEVYLLHVTQRSPWRHQELLEEAKDYWAKAEKLIEEYGNSLAEPLSRLIPCTRVKIISADHIGKALIDYADENECDLVVTGDHENKNLIDRVLLGSTGRFVLRNAKCSVAVVRSVKPE